ncbi:uncharacterized protein LOC131018175 [Salvia miltiorrhiza]|uniref:uncharacterized protein LOC131018175 n=1 Tax=Salvia miltiorrhiza TaxID=226208 RepID=UPI0025AB9828|nr:uncharacterized protein LOC131018175 [Salvia miltiorrhiza]
MEPFGVMRPPILDGANYSAWRIRIRQYIKAIDLKAWHCVEEGWSAPKTTDAHGDVILTPPAQWSRAEFEEANFNEKAMHAIYSFVDMNMFNLIKNNTSAKEQWDILQRHCEGDTSVKETRLRLLTTKFENMKMDEGEDIKEYSKRILSVANECRELGDPISNRVLVSKALRTLPPRFEMKITTIETSQNVASLEFVDLMNTLRTYEMTLEERGLLHKKKAVAFNAGCSSTTTTSSHILQIRDLEDSEELEEIHEGDDVALITRKFNNMVRKLRRTKENDREGSSPRHDSAPPKRNDFTPPRPMRKVSSTTETFRYDPNFINNVQCRECKGFGHYANQCANTLRKRGKSYWVSWSDDEAEFFDGSESSKEEKEDDDDPGLSAFHVKFGKTLSDDEDDEGDQLLNRYDTGFFPNCLCFNACVGNTEESNEETMLVVMELKKFYDELLGKWKKQGEELEATKEENVKLKGSLAKLEASITQKEVKLEHVTSQLEEAQITIAKWNSSRHRYDDFVSAGTTDTTGLGYTAAPAVESTPGKTKVKSTHGKEFVVERTSVGQTRPQRKRYVCHYCFQIGHIQPFCFRKFNDEKKIFVNSKKTRAKGKKNPPQAHRKVWKWVRKDELKCNVVFTALKTNISSSWYFDSGCSRHMTGDNSYLNNYQVCDGGFVSFGGGSKGKIIGKGTLNVPGLPCLKNVFHVKGLMANLISISQLCDENLHVKFNKDSCEVFDTQNCCVMKGQRSSDNCYLVDDPKCNKAQIDESMLWHQKLGHTNFKNLDRLSKLEAVRGLPKITQKEKEVCESCQKGKQIHATHRATQQAEQHFGTTRCFELIHMDLVGPVGVESIGGKRYVYVLVDDFSRFTWTFFLREKSETIDVFKTLFARFTNMFGVRIARMRSDHGREFENAAFTKFCEKKGIFQEFSAPKTPQQNGVVERKNRTLVEMARVMLASKKLAQRFWAEAVSTACHINNRVNIKPGTFKTPYEILRGKKPNLKYFHVFGCVCYILNDREYLTKFDEKSDKCTFLGYSLNSQAYRVFNLRSQTIQESVNVVFDDVRSIADENNREGQVMDIVMPAEDATTDAEATEEITP